MSNRETGKGALLLLGAHRQTLAVMRALGPEGWRIVLGQPPGRGRSYVGHSRWVDALWVHPELKEGMDPQRWLDELERLLEAQPDIRFLFPIGQDEISAIDAIRNRLPRQLQCVMVESDVIVACLDKTRMLNLVSDLGIPVAPFVEVNERSDILSAADGIGYPCVVKPVSSSETIFGRKAFIARTREQLANVLTDHSRPRGRVLAQKYVHGQRHCLYFMAVQGRLSVTAQTVINRTNRLDGTGYGVDGESVPVSDEWADHLRRIVTALRYQGTGCLQYIVDEGSKQVTFLEINARLGGNYAGNELFGMHLARWWLQVAAGAEPDIASDWSYRSGVRYRWLQGDLNGWIQSFSDPGVTRRDRWNWAARMPGMLFGSGHLTWNWRDPVPSLVLYFALFKQVASRIQAGSTRSQRLGRAPNSDETSANSLTFPPSK